MGNTMTFKTKQDYTPEQMIDIMKDVAFEAGEPQLIKYALTHRIVFPALDSSNQVQVMKTGVNKWAVTRMDEAKTGALVGNSALFSIFGRLFAIFRLFNPNRKKALALVQDTYNKLAALNL